MMHKNENRPGYKKTKVGWIPEGWDGVLLGQVFSLTSGKTRPQDASNDNSLIPVFGGNGVMGYSALSNNDGENLIIGRVGEKCGCVHRHSGKCWITDNSLFVTEYKRKTDVPFLYHSLSHLQLNRFKKKAGQPLVSQQLIYDLGAGIPPLPEQKAIAEVLECWDGGIRNLELRIVKKKQIKKGLMQKLLAGTIRLSGFSKPWKNVKLEEVLTEHKETSSGREEVHSVSVHKGVINQVEHLGRSYAAKDTANYNLVKPGDIIYTKSPTGDFPYGIIKQSTLDKDVIVSPLYGVFTPMTIYLGVMLDAYFASPVNTGNYLRPIIQKGAKNTINITNSTFLSGKLNLPLDKKEQQAIAEVLTAADSEIEALERKLALWREQKKYLLNNLVTGTIRLPEFVKNMPQKSTRSA